MTAIGLVLDASTALSWCFEDEWTRAGEEILGLVQQDGAVVPPLWDLEITNVFAGAERRGRITRSDTERFVTLLHQLPIETSEHDPAAGDLLALARESGLTSYDACYLLTAMQAGLPLATLDQRLRRAAAAVGVAILPDPRRGHVLG